LKVTINPPDLPPRRGSYSHVVRSGALVFISGLGPRSSAGELLEDGIEGQTLVVLNHMRACIEAAGGSLNDICSVTTFLANLAGDFAGYDRAYQSVFRVDPPTRATVQAGLPGILIEMQAVAVLPRRVRVPNVRPTAAPVTRMQT
jgi:2-iminobutanoate/2-iminopropanoate deaminase